MRSPQNPLSKPRLGCLGSLVAFFVLGVVFVLALTAVFAPWGFYLGGNFHIVPYWQGWGRLRAKAELTLCWCGSSLLAEGG
jgi:hypothetical protein